MIGKICEELKKKLKWSWKFLKLFEVCLIKQESNGQISAKRK